VPAKVLAVGGVNRVPDGLSFAEASVAEPLACVVNGQEQAGVGDGDADAVEAVRKLTDGRGADVIVVAAASATAQEDALRMAARRARP
jgi:L-iditol 2-dehydrogenase